MQIALECPTELLEDIIPLTDFDFILAHKVLQDKAYTSFYKDSGKAKILDNSVNELKNPTDVSLLLEASERVKANYIIAPDWLCDAKQTSEFYPAAKKLLGSKAIPVIHGQSYQEMTECAEHAFQVFGGNVVAVPFRGPYLEGGKRDMMAGFRVLVVASLVGKFKWIHLLGATELWELAAYSASFYDGTKITMDTGLPVQFGLRGMRFGEEHLDEKGKPAMDKMEETRALWEENLVHVFYNIAYMRTLSKRA